MNLYKILLFSILFLITQITLSQCEGTCEWLYQDLDTESYNCENNTLELFYCENIMDTIYAPDIYTEAVWEYSIENGQTCQDWDWIGEDIFFSIDSNDPCIDNLTNNTITVKFVGYTDQQNNTSADTCIFDLTFHEFPTPFIDVEDYNTDTQIILCEENLITLTASGLGTEDIENTNIQWFLNGNILENENSISLDINNIDYDINTANVFSFTVSNYCTSISKETATSDWLTISIYEGYNECEPCSWELPDYSKNQIYGFTPNEDGDNDYFPEKPNNEENRSPETIPTCEATKYRISIYNRLGRELFKSKYDNHPWDGKLSNGKKCKDGTYYYKMEYVLNPYVTDYNQDQTKITTGSVYLDSSN